MEPLEQNKPIETAETTRKPAGLWEIFSVFAKIGLFTFGGGLAMLPMIERAVVQQKSWLQDSEFNEMLVVTNALPGAFAVNIAISIGNRERGFVGALIGAIGTMLPSFVVLLIVAYLLLLGQDIELLNKFFLGVRPAVVALLFDAALRLGKKNIKTIVDWLILIAGTLIIAFTGINSALIILAGGLIGLSYYRSKLKKNNHQEEK